MTAELDILTIGYADDRVASTCTLIRDGSSVIVVDPGMVARRELLLNPLTALGLKPTDISDIVISHHHPDHTMNVALFPNARVHDFMASYQADVWIDREPGPYDLSPAVRLLPTPGHTDQDITTLVRTASGLIALTHLWWNADGPADDPFAADPSILAASRQVVLELKPTLIVPGHGAPFAPNSTTAR